MKRTILRFDHLETRIAPAVATWDAGGADNNWTNAANWVGDVAPQAGDDLVFPAGAVRLVSANDFPTGTAFRSIAIQVPAYQLTGNAVALAAGLTVNGALAVGPNATVIGLPLILTADQTFAIDIGGYLLS